MITTSAKEDQLYIGIDGGGTKCRATVFSTERGVIGTGVGGPANPLHGFERTLESITVSTELAMKDAGLDFEQVGDIVAGLGLAGVNLPELFQKVNNWDHPFKKMFLTTDLHTACIGAHEGGDGAVIITGTGSCGFSYVNGESTILGGHGFSQGDKGSGAWVGLEAIKACLLDLDDLGPKTLITEKILAHFGVTGAMEVAEQMAGKPSSTYGQFTRMILSCAEAGDTVAIEIIRDGAQYISDLARKLLEKNPPRLSMIGGLAEPLQKWLDPDVAAIVQPALQPPEIGAVYYAQQSLAAEL